MMTPQEVASSTFPKATLGGYNMAAVDVFLDKLTEDYTTLYKENAALKAKIKVLVDKMEEYHAMEDTMRTTLLTAQKMANGMIAEAEEKRNTMLADAQTQARERMAELSAEIAAQEQRLVAARAEIDQKIMVENERIVTAQRELVAFINAGKKLCTRQLELIERLPELEILPVSFAMPEDIAPEAEEIPEVKMPEPVTVTADADTTVIETVEDEEAAAAALAEVKEELGGDASSLMESMRSVIDSFANAGEMSEEDESDGPFEIGFDDAGDLFDNDDDKKDADPFDHADDDDYDNFDGEDKDATRVLNLNDLQFGRNYNKD